MLKMQLHVGALKFEKKVSIKHMAIIKKDE